LTILNVGLRDSESIEHFLEFANDQLGIVRVSRLGCGDDFEEGHTCTIVVNHHLVALNEALCRFLLHLDTLNQDMVLILLVIVEKEAAIEHDRVVLLCDLVRLREVCVHIVLPVELDLGKDASSKGKRRLDGLVEALFVKDGEHSWETQVNEVSMGVRIHTCRVEGSRKHLVLGVHLYMEFEADCALPSLHELREFASAVLTVAEALLMLPDLSGGEEHGWVRGDIGISHSGTADERNWLKQIETLHC